MFSDPQSVTYAAVAKSLPATGRGEDASIYKLFDSGGISYEFTLSHSFAKRNRIIARLKRTAIVADPLVTATNFEASATATLTVDFPTSGLTPTDAQLLAKALVGWASDANLLKLANGET